MKFYIEVSRPLSTKFGRAHIGCAFRVFRSSEYCADVLSPCMTAVIEVDCAGSKDEAVAVALEKLAGENVAVRVIMGGRREPPTPREKRDENLATH
jgi:hypothetical protein